MRPKVKLVANIRIINVYLLNILTIITPPFHWSYCHKEHGIDRNYKAHSLNKRSLVAKNKDALLFQLQIQQKQQIRWLETMNAGVHQIKLIWERHTMRWCRQVCFTRRALAFVVLLNSFASLNLFIVQQHCPSLYL